MDTRRFIALLGAACILAMAGLPAVAATITYGDNVVGLVKMIDLDPTRVIDSVAGVCFDPTYTNAAGDYDRVYLANRVDPEEKRGLYSVVISTETVSGRLALAGAAGDTALNQPYDVAVDGAGDVYVTYTATASIWKVADPSGTPVETKILGAYGGSGDDDPSSLDLVPAGFGLAGYDTNDLILFDNGINNNNGEALVAVKADGSAYGILWNDGDAVDNNIRGASNPVDGKCYVLRYGSVPVVDIGGTEYPAIHRFGSDGALEMVALDLPADVSFNAPDDAIAVNPADGTVWVTQVNGEGRLILRVDPLAATDAGSGVFLAPTTVEINIDKFNIGSNSIAFSPDGKFLVAGYPDGADTMYVFTTVPEPGCAALVALGLASLAVWYCRGA
ncbi:MAG: hypothetical protein JW809_15045 [Pirellulales bacterium]|nr:hypothetical protein [Pirellulales bacterium]